MSPHSKAKRDRVMSPQEYRKCARKARYADRGVALKHGRRSMAERYDGQLWIYRCSFCKGWHLTRWDNGEANRVVLD